MSLNRFYLLSIRRRILYFLYENQLTLPELMKKFSTNELNDVEKQLFILVNEHIIENTSNKIQLHNILQDQFLRVLHYIWQSQKPLTRSEIRDNVKNKDLNQIIDDLLNSGLCIEYRMQLSKKNYIFPSHNKDHFITLLENETRVNLKQSKKLCDKSHLIMLNKDYSILSYSQTDYVDFEITNKQELKLVVNLYRDIGIKKLRKIGFNFDYIVEKIYNGNKKQAEKNILNLMNKGILLCSYQHYYYLNNAIIPQLKPIYLDNQKLVINEPKNNFC